MHELMKSTGIFSFSKREKVVQVKYDELMASGLTLREQYRQQIAKHGVLCLSENPSSLLMWAHYAEGHVGYRLTFDTEKWQGFQGVEKVLYQDKYPEVDVWSLVHEFIKSGQHNHSASDAAGKVSVLRKSSEWEYEHEWRLISELPGHISFTSNSLVQLAFGCNTPESVIEKIQRTNHLRVIPTKLVRMKQDEKAYKLLECDL